jgi:carboxymethylenebutenolidase
MTKAWIPVGDGGRCDAYITRPTSGRNPAVVLIPAIFGATPGIEEFARDLSGQGFAVVVPDLFWRTLPGPLGYEGADRDKAQDRYKKFDVEKGFEDLRNIIAWCGGQEFSTGRTGVVGMCFGGRYAVVAAANLGAAAAATFHGTFIGKHLDVLSRIACPVSLHFGEADPHVPMSEVNDIAKASSENQNIEIFTYPEAPHGFMQQDRASYRADAARLAWDRGVATLKKGLAT